MREADPDWVRPARVRPAQGYFTVELKDGERSATRRLHPCARPIPIGCVPHGCVPHRVILRSNLKTMLWVYPTRDYFIVELKDGVPGCATCTRLKRERRGTTTRRFPGAAWQQAGHMHGPRGQYRPRQPDRAWSGHTRACPAPGRRWGCRPQPCCRRRLWRRGSVR